MLLLQQGQLVVEAVRLLVVGMNFQLMSCLSLSSSIKPIINL